MIGTDLLILALCLIGLGFALGIWQRGRPPNVDRPFGDPQNRRDRKWRSF